MERGHAQIAPNSAKPVVLQRYRSEVYEEAGSAPSYTFLIEQVEALLLASKNLNAELLLTPPASLNMSYIVKHSPATKKKQSV